MYKDHIRLLTNLQRREVFQFAPDGKKYYVTGKSVYHVWYMEVGGIVRHSLSRHSARRINVICHGC